MLKTAKETGFWQKNLHGYGTVMVKILLTTGKKFQQQSFMSVLSRMSADLGTKSIWLRSEKEHGHSQEKKTFTTGERANNKSSLDFLL